MTRPNIASVLPPRASGGVARISILQADAKTIDADLDRRAVLLLLEGLARMLGEAERREQRNRGA